MSEPVTSAAQAPWFYRKRFTVFGLVYGVAFFAGYLIAGVVGQSLAPVFVSSGRPVLFGALAIACGLGGYALRVWASSYLSSSIVWNEDVLVGELRVSGPYRFTRNPLYLGNVVQSIGVGLLGPWPVFVLVVAGVLALDLALIVIEENALTREAGPAYQRYRSRVARLVPLPWKIAPGGGQRGSLRDGLRAETMTAVFATAVIIIAALRWPR
jgi:protein-S-isoprenylcysteine O-methyltransferase Ste14